MLALAAGLSVVGNAELLAGFRMELVVKLKVKVQTCYVGINKEQRQEHLPTPKRLKD